MAAFWIGWFIGGFWFWSARTVSRGAFRAFRVMAWRCVSVFVGDASVVHWSSSSVFISRFS